MRISDWSSDVCSSDLGGRRFLPVRIMPGSNIDIDRIGGERDQLWAEAVQLFKDGFQYWVLPDEAEEEQEQRFIEDSWEGRIARWLDGRMKAIKETSDRKSVGSGKRRSVRGELG